MRGRENDPKELNGSRIRQGKSQDREKYRKAKLEDYIEDRTNAAKSLFGILPPESKMVWGVLSHDDMSGVNEPTMDSMTDLALIYWPATGDYTLDIETIYDFNGKQAATEYLHTLLDAFTTWMGERGYDTDAPLSMEIVFSGKRRYKTIEQAYAHFKLQVFGWTEVNSHE